MKLSILIPVYNVEKYLKECLESVLCQRFNDYEIILIDDGSSDGSSEICDIYSSKYDAIKTIHKKNEGLILARRDAIDYAQGEYCLFLDSDDKLREGCLDLLSTYMNQGVDMVLFNLSNWDSDINVVIDRRPVFDHECIFSDSELNTIREVYLTTDYLNNMVIKLIKRCIISNDPIDYRNGNYSSYGEDALQSAYLFDQARQIVYLPISFYLYRKNSNSITQSAKSFSQLSKMINFDFYNLKKSYGTKWGIWNEDIEKASAIQRLLFISSIFIHNYMLMDNKKERKQFVNCDWNSFLLKEHTKHLTFSNLKMRYFEIMSIFKGRFVVCELFRAARLIRMKKKRI